MITPQIIRHIADLARIGVGDKEIMLLAEECARILDFVERLNELDTTGVRPFHEGFIHTNALRKDMLLEQGNHSQTSKLQQMFPAQKNGYGAVPSVFVKPLASHT